MRGPTWISVRCEMPSCDTGSEQDIPLNLTNAHALYTAAKELTDTLTAEGWHIDTDVVWCPFHAARNEGQ